MGHVFVVAGNLTQISCDALLIPTDVGFNISSSFSRFILGADGGGRLDGVTWDEDELVTWFRRDDQVDVWLGNSGVDSADAGRSLSVIEPFIKGAKERARDLVGDRLVVAAVNVLATGDGGSARDKGTINERLIPMLYGAAEKHSVDIVLVCWKRPAYSAAQRVRRRWIKETHDGDLGAVWDLGSQTEKLVDVAKGLADHARDGDLVLFLGAGVSAGAGLPAWQDMLSKIGATLDPKIGSDVLKRLDFRDQAAVLDRRLSRESPPRSLQEAVAKALPSTRPSLLHGLLASLPTSEAITTNYDDLFENAVAPIDGPIAVLPYDAAKGRRWMLKLHGSIDREKSIVLTRSDYLTIPERHGALVGLVQAMLLTHHMLFVGYSLRDEDFHVLVHEVECARGGDADQREPLGTVLTLFRDELFEELWSSTLAVVPLDQPADDSSVDSIVAASRQLAILLDLVGFLAADLDTSILDPTYALLLDEEEREIATLLDPLVRRLLGDATPPVTAPVAERIRTLLSDLGAISPTSSLIPAGRRRRSQGSR